jgi:hypothetical protein
MRGSDDCSSRVICCCGSGLKPVEKFLDNGRSIGYFCEECYPWRIKTFMRPNDPESTKDDV